MQNAVFNDQTGLRGQEREMVERSLPATLMFDRREGSEDNDKR